MTRLGLPGLLRRQRKHSRGAARLVALLVLGVSVLVVAAPSAFTRMLAEEFEQTIQDATPTGRHLVATIASAPATGPSRDPSGSTLPPELQGVYGGLEDELDDVRDGLPEPLKSSVGPARWSLRTAELDLGRPNQATNPPGAGQGIVLHVDPYAAEKADLVEGTWPPVLESVDADTPVGVVLSEDSAERLAWKVGTRRGGFLLTGIFRPRDAGDDYWALNPSMLQPHIFDDGNSPPSITATAFADPLFYTNALAFAPDPRLTMWFPLDLHAVAGQDVDKVLAQLRGVTAKSYPVSGERAFVGSATFKAAGIPALEAAQGRADAARSVLTLAGMGPLGAGLLALLLAVRALALRLRQSVGLLANRGASRLQLRTMLALVGLLAGLPAAGVAIGAGWLVFRDDLRGVGIVLALGLGLLPALVLSSVRIDAAMRPARADSGFRSQSRHRWVVETGILGLAAASVYLLESSGLKSTEAGGGVDLLVAAAPVLLAAAACVVVLRLYPVPLQFLARSLQRGRSSIGFLGSIRALRDPSAGVAPVLAVLAGVAVAVFSASVLATVDKGAHDAALIRVGSDLRIEGPVVSDEQLGQLQGVDGVTAVARLQRTSARQIAAPGTPPTQAMVFLADLEQLAAAQADVAGGFTSTGDVGAQSAFVSTEFRSDERTISYADGESPVVGTAANLPGVTDGETNWIVADGRNPVLGPFLPDTTLVAVGKDVDRGEVRDAIADILGPDVAVSDSDQIERDLRSDAISTGLRTALLAALVAAGIAAAATVVLSLVLGAGSRTRILAILRVLGYTRRQRRWLAVWEQAPLAGGALVVGCLLGIGLAVLLHGVIDLSPFAGSEDQPPLTFEWLTIVGLLGAFVVLMTGSIGLGLLVTRRTSAAAAVRLDEE